MLYRLIAAFLGITLTFPLFGQMGLRGRILCEKDSLPLAYVHVGVIGKSVGTITDEVGFFQLAVQDLQWQDTLRVSMLGYANFDWLVPQRMPSDTVDFYLSTTSYLLPEITFYPEGEKIQLGARRRSLTQQVWGAGGVASGEELGRLFRLDDGPVRLDTFRFHLRRNNSDSMLFRLNLYAVKDQWPDQPLLNKDIRFLVRKGDNEAEDGWITVDLTAEDLVVEDDFIATIELLRNWVGYGYSPIFVSFNRGREPALIRQSSQAPWKKEKPRRPFAFIFEGIR